MSPTQRRQALVALVALLLPVRAEAHLVTTGLGPVYDGIGHLLLTPEDLVPAIALALFAGLRGARPGRWALFLLPVAWLTGGLGGLGSSLAAPFPLHAISLLLLGALVAVDAKLRPGAVAAIAAALGLAHGFLNGQALRGMETGALGLLGITALLFVVVALVAAFVVSLRRPWARIAVRVAGSWIAAVGLLMLGWSLRTPRPRAAVPYLPSSAMASTPATTVAAHAIQPDTSKAAGCRYVPINALRRPATRTTPSVAGRIKPLSAPARTSKRTGRPSVRKTARDPRTKAASSARPCRSASGCDERRNERVV